ncbi:MAG: hypothetical protein M1840_001963 [Geoglossum simile]|nr:MAG: hypothetical protein M1840_001963 [Geoglossum simile]
MVAFGDGNHGFQVGQSYGPINAEIHLAPERPETPPNPSANIPFPRDLDFVNRGTLLDQIYEKLSVPASRAALVGLGGVGKSQLAIEHSYQVRDKSQDTWVFWVHGSNATRFEHSFREVADLVKIPDRRNPKANIFKLVHDWLRDEKKGKWVLILDNVDDADFLLKPPVMTQEAQEGGLSSGFAQSLLRYLPLSRNGSILITTRSRNMALKLVEESNIIAVEPMDKAHALALFERKLGKQSDKTDIAELVTALEFMPLAIVQAAAYIKERAPRCSVRQYIEKFQKGDKAKTSLLDHDAGHLRRDWEAKNSILITWQISFDYIFQIRQSAADLLSLMSFFDRQGIPEALVRYRSGTGNRHRDSGANNRNSEESDGEDSASEASIEDGFEDDILTLRNYSFISLTTDATIFEMHGLVQLATRKWLEGQGQLEGWKQQYIKNLCIEFPAGYYENWPKCQVYFPHAKSVLLQQPKGEESLREWALLLYNAAWYAWARGSSIDAEKMSMKSMKVRKKLLGEEHEDTLSSMAMVALACNLKGQWKEAEELNVQVMETCKRVLGEEHPSTLTSMANLASTFRNQGRWKEAEELQAKELEICSRVLGEEHPDTLTSMANLASTYRNQGRWKEAEELEVQVMETRKRVLGEEHPDTLTSMANLASTYWNQGRWKEAEELEVQVMETSKRVLGEEHPSTLTSMANLASTYWNQGRWKEAEELQAKELEICSRVLGEEHPDTLTSMANLASTYRNQGRWKEAEELEVQVMETSKRVLGEEHPYTLTSMANLAFMFKSQGCNREAILLLEKCFKLQEKVLGPQHPYTTSSLEALNEWQLENGGGRPALAIPLRGSPVVAFSPDGKQIASGSCDRTIKLWDVAKSLKVSRLLGSTIGSSFKFRAWKEIKTSGTVYSLKFSEDGLRLITNLGPIKIESVLTDSHSPDYELLDLWVGNQWIYYGAMPVFPLMSDFELRWEAIKWLSGSETVMS